MKFAVVSLFPQMFAAVKEYGITARAERKGLISVEAINPRDFTEDVHRTVDDRPYGGGPGMVMMVNPLRCAIASAKEKVESGASDLSAKVIYLSPQGKPFSQKMAQELADAKQPLVLVAGRYEGLDQRLLDQDIDEEISIGDFVVSGGELPAMMLIDAVARCVPDVLGHELSAQTDSFSDGLLDFPHYTRPEVDEQTQMAVPAVLLSGNHKAIALWRLQQALGQTWLKRPELLENRKLSEQEQQLLQAFQEAYKEHE